jgi:hypothetical protein
VPLPRRGYRTQPGVLAGISPSRRRALQGRQTDGYTIRHSTFNPGNGRRSKVPSGRTLSLDIPALKRRAKYCSSCEAPQFGHFRDRRRRKRQQPGLSGADRRLRGPGIHRARLRLQPFQRLILLLENFLGLAAPIGATQTRLLSFYAFSAGPSGPGLYRASSLLDNPGVERRAESCSPCGAKTILGLSPTNPCRAKISPP